MPSSLLLVVLLGFMVLAYHFGYKRAVSVAGGPRRIKTLHSLPAYYGYFSAIYSVLPALALLGIWVLFEERLIMALVAAKLPAAYAGLTEGQLDLFLNTVRNAAGAGRVVSLDPAVEAAALHYQSLYSRSHWLLVPI